MRLRATFAALALAATASSAFAAEEAKTYTKEELQKIILETILDNPKTIIQSIERMQAQQVEDEQRAARDNVVAYSTSLLNDPASPVAGNKKGDVTVVEFFDYNCGYCKRSLGEVLKLSQNDKNVRFVFKEYPVLAPSSETAARASLAMYALNPDRYFDYHAALFRLGGKFDEENLASVAEGMGVDTAKFLAKMKDPAITKHLEDNKQLAAKLGARGVPLFIIGTEVSPGAISYEMMKSHVDATREAQQKAKGKK